MSTVRITSPASKNGICIYSGSFDVSAFDWFWLNAGVSDESRMRLTFFRERSIGELKAGRELRKVLKGNLNAETKAVPHCVINPLHLNLARHNGHTLRAQEAKTSIVTQDADSVTIDVDLTNASFKKAWDKVFYTVDSTMQKKPEPRISHAVTPQSPSQPTELTRIGHITLSSRVTLAELKRMFGDRSHITITDANNNMLDVDLIP